MVRMNDGEKWKGCFFFDALGEFIIEELYIFFYMCESSQHQVIPCMICDIA